MTNEIFNMYARIKALGISELDQRQPLLVELIAAIVNHETEDGKLTAAAGNTALERMDYWANLKSVLRDFDFKFLGNGHFSAAFAHDFMPGRAIKVGFKKEDSGAAYTAWCRANQGRVGVPNVYHVARHAGCYTVVLDKLWSCNKDDMAQFDAAAVARRGVEYGALSNEDIATSTQGEWTPELAALFDTAVSIRAFFKDIASFDMHAGNIMFSADGTPFITDPVSFTPTGGAIDRCTDKFDVEALLREVEAQVIIDMKTKALRRHVHKLARKERMKANQRRRLEARRGAKNKAQRRAVAGVRDKAFSVGIRQLRLIHGETQANEVWLRNGWDELHDIAARYKQKAREAVALHGLIGVNGLPIDIANQRLLMG